jgi:pimeloyl-ACP methyl ester carboxylesterase
VPPTPEVRGWSRLIAGVADQVLLRTVQDIHRAVTDAGFRLLGPVGRPVQRVTDALTDAAYDTVRVGFFTAGEIAAAAAGPLGSAGPASPAAVKARAIAHGVVGDELIALAPELDLELTLRRDGEDIPVDAASLRHAYPDARCRLVLFVHGLVDTEAVWFEHDEGGTTLPDRVAAAGATPLLVRYGTGRSIARNGAALDALLEVLVADWPVAIEELIVVGHSMGGLVTRSACLHATRNDHAWIRRLDDVVYLATPHLGSWLEKFANVLSWTLRRDARSAPIGRLLDGRSRGIKELRFGTIDPDAIDVALIDDLLTGLAPDEPWAADVTHHVVVGRLRDGRHPLNATFGDALVRAGSASGRGRRRQIAAGGEVVTIEVAESHTKLARHPRIARLLDQILAGEEPESTEAAVPASTEAATAGR